MRPLLTALAAALALAACAPSVPPGTAMVVNGQAQPVHLYDVLLAAAAHEVGAANGPVITDQALAAGRRASLQAGALRTLADDTLIEQLAAARHLSVTPAELAAQLARLEAAAGGRAALDRYVAARGVTRADYIAFLRIRLLEDKLGGGNAVGYEALLASARRSARIEAYVGPCAQRHDYPACAGAPTS